MDTKLVGSVGDEMQKSRLKSRGWTVHQDGADWWERDVRGPIASSSVEKQQSERETYSVWYQRIHLLQVNCDGWEVVRAASQRQTLGCDGKELAGEGWRGVRLVRI